MLQNKIRDKNLKQSKDKVKGYFYRRWFSPGPIFKVEYKTSTTNMKCLLKGCDWYVHNTLISKNFYKNLQNNKLPTITHLSVVNSLLEKIPDLDIHPNGTNRGFGPLIMEEDINQMD